MQALSVKMHFVIIVTDINSLYKLTVAGHAQIGRLTHPWHEKYTSPLDKETMHVWTRD